MTLLRRGWWLRLPALGAGLLLLSAPADELVADFEGRDFGSWTATGTAFGDGPARGTLPDQAPVGGFRGQGLANSFHGGDRAVGTLTSPEFTLNQRYLNFLIGGGALIGKTCVTVLVKDQVVRSATGRDEESLTTATFDLGEFVGQGVRIRLVDAETGGWGHISADHFLVSDKAAVPPYVQNPVASMEYTERLRPQFHFTARFNWLAQPSGLVFLDGEYHLFFPHSPQDSDGRNQIWGHAVSRNLVHWTQLGSALEAEPGGTLFSGSVVVDHRNTSGLQKEKESVLVALYSTAGGTSESPPPQRSCPHPGDFGTNFYAAQAGEGLPDWRVILLSWLQGVRYPEMPFNSPE